MNKTKFAEKCAFVKIFIIITIVFCLLGKGKYILFCDEIYSYESVNIVTEDKTNPYDSFNEPLSNKDIEEYMGASDLNPHFWKLQKDLYRDHVPLYFYILRLISIMNSNSWSHWTGLALNYIFYIWLFSMLWSYFINLVKSNDIDSKEPTAGEFIKKTSLVTVSILFLYMHPVMSVDLAMTVRMYMMMAFFIFAFFKLSPNGEMLTKKEGVTFGMFITGGLLTHFYFWIYAGIYSALYCISLMLKKKWKEFFQYIIIFALSGIVTSVIFPQWIRNIFMSPTQKGWTSLMSIFDFSSFTEKISGTLKACNRILFFDTPVYILIPFLFIVSAVILYLIVNDKENVKAFIASKKFLIILSSIIYIIFVGYTQPDEGAVERYFWVPSFVILIATAELFIKAIMLSHARKLKVSNIIYVIYLLVFFAIIITSAINVFTLKNEGYLAKTEAKVMTELKDYKDIPWLVVSDDPNAYAYKYMLTIPSSFAFVKNEDAEAILTALQAKGAESIEPDSLLDKLDLQNQLLILKDGRYEIIDINE